MNSIKDIVSIVMIGRRWWDKTNTYHTTEVVVSYNHGLVIEGKTKFSYGNDLYVQSGVDWLVENDILPKECLNEVFWRYCKDNKIHKYCTVVDVARKKDL